MRNLGTKHTNQKIKISAGQFFPISKQCLSSHYASMNTRYDCLVLSSVIFTGFPISNINNTCNHNRLTDCNTTLIKTRTL